MKNFIPLLFSSAFFLSSLFAQPMEPFGQNTSQFSAPTSSINWLTNYQEAISRSQAASKPIVILFTGTSWCPACMKLEREVLNHPAFTQTIAQKFIFLKAEFPNYATRNSPYQPLLERYHVQAFPTFVVINSNGQQLYTIGNQSGGPQAYVRALLQGLPQQSSNNFSNQPNFNPFQ